MRIEVEVDIPRQTVMVDIGPDDVVSALYQDSEDYTAHQQVVRAANNLAAVFRKLPDEAITGLSPQARQTIKKFLLEQAARFEC